MKGVQRTRRKPPALAAGSSVSDTPALLIRMRTFSFRLRSEPTRAYLLKI